MKNQTKMAVKRLQSNTPVSTPKLLLSSLPIKRPRDTPGSKTPPFGSSVSIPFQWEEAPGKPRTGFSNSGRQNPVARCLELPPRLITMNESAKLTGLPSPTTVLEGPDNDPCRDNPLSPGRRISSTCSNSNSMSRRRLVRKDTRWKLGSSWRWGSSFREVRVLATTVTGSDEDDSSSRRRVVVDDDETAAAAAVLKLKRKSGFLNNIANIRERFKHAVTWRRKQEQD